MRNTALTDAVPTWLGELVRPRRAPVPWPDMIRAALAICLPPCSAARSGSRSERLSTCGVPHGKEQRDVANVYSALAAKLAAIGTDRFQAARQGVTAALNTAYDELLAVRSTSGGRNRPMMRLIAALNAADRHGDALYADVENMPGVSAALITRCLPPGLATTIYQQTGLVTLDASTTGCAWQTGHGTPVPGIFDASQEPHTIRTDYVENSNDSYWLGNEMITERVAGTDGLGAPKFTVPTMQQMWENDRSLLAELVLRQLVSACRQAPVQTASNGTTVNLAAACAALAGYEKYQNGDLNASGGWLFTIWQFSFNSGSPWAVPFSPAEPLTTPSGLNTANPDVLRALADAVLSLQASHIPLAASFGQVQHATRGTDVIPIHGCATGCFNAIATSLGTGDPFSPGDYGEVVQGSSMVLTTELTPAGPVAQGILTYSQATNPLSPWYANMTRLYSQKRWVKLPYTPAQLAAQPGNHTETLPG